MIGSPAPTVSVAAGTLPTGLTLSSARVLLGHADAERILPGDAHGDQRHAAERDAELHRRGQCCRRRSPAGNTDTFTVGTADRLHGHDHRVSGADRVADRRAAGRRHVHRPRGACSAGPRRKRASFPLVFTATNGTPPDATQNFTLNVVCPAIVVNPATITDGLYQVAHAGVTFTQTGSTGSSSPGAQPAATGVTIGATTGVVSGVPTNTVLNGAVVIIATDNFGCQGTHHTTMTVHPTTNREPHGRCRPRASPHAFPGDAARGLRR